MTATLPPEVREVFERFITTEYVTIDAKGQPIAWPVTPYHHPAEGCVDVTTGIGFFGHAVGETTEDVKALIAAAPSFPGPGFLMPIRNAELFRWCLEQGLRIVQPMTLMSLGTYDEPQGAFLPSVLY